MVRAFAILPLLCIAATPLRSPKDAAQQSGKPMVNLSSITPPPMPQVAVPQAVPMPSRTYYLQWDDPETGLMYEVQRTAKLPPTWAVWTNTMAKTVKIPAGYYRVRSYNTNTPWSKSDWATAKVIPTH